MTAYLHTLIALVAEHRTLIYALVLVLALAESLPLVGAIMPGTALIVGISALVPSGAVSLWPLLLSATLGAIAGDGFSFWLGRHYHRNLINRWPFTRYPDLMPRGEVFFNRHGGKSVFLARFTPGVRAIIPVVAGIARMPMERFYVVNILSALAWAPLHIFSGALVGASLVVTGAVAGRLAFFLALFLVVLWLVAWSVRFALRWGLPRLTIVQERIAAWARARDSWTRRQILGLLDPKRLALPGLTLAAILLIGGAWLFFGVLEDLLSGDPLVRANAAVYQFFQSLRTVWGDRIMIGLTELGDGAVTTVVTGVVFLWLAWRKTWRPAAYWAGAVAFAAVFTTAVKLAVQLPRPVAVLYSGWSAFSFPSGHTTVNATLYGFLAFLIAREVRPRWRGVIAAATTVLIVAIALSRLYLGAHWLSDVLAGLAFGAAWVALLSMAYLRHNPPKLPVTRLAMVFCVTLASIGGLHIYLRYPLDVQRYAIRLETQTLAAAAWWTQDWRGLPARRIDLAGDWEEPLTVQWAGSLEQLQQQLLPKGWRKPVPWTPKNALAWLAVKPDPAQLPVLPQLQDGRPPALTLLYPQAPDTRLVLRLWATGIALKAFRANLQPLWVGTVVKQQLRQAVSLLTVPGVSPDANGPRQKLATMLDNPRLALRPGVADPHWNGQVLLAHSPAITVQKLNQAKAKAHPRQ